MALTFDLPVITADEAATEALGHELAGQLEPGTVIALHGDLGAGKTVISRGIARGLGIGEPVTSPTFAIVQEYPGPRCRLYHLDMYRLQGVHDAIAFGVEDFLNDPEAVAIIEWAERIDGILPRPHLSIELRRGPGEGRTIRLAWVG